MYFLYKLKLCLKKNKQWKSGKRGHVLKELAHFQIFTKSVNCIRNYAQYWSSEVSKIKDII